jgi:hypothetical protein
MDISPLSYLDSIMNGTGPCSVLVSSLIHPVPLFDIPDIGQAGPE